MANRPPEPIPKARHSKVEQIDLNDEATSVYENADLVSTAAAYDTPLRPRSAPPSTKDVHSLNSGNRPAAVEHPLEDSI